MLRRSDLRWYQVAFIDIMKRCWATSKADRLPGVIFALEPGGGKTGAVLTLLRDLLDTFMIRKALIVANLLVAQTVWPDEMEEWEHTKALTWTLIRVEDDDPEMLAAGADAYAESFERYTAEFEAARRAEIDIGLGKRLARADAKRRLGGAPSERAEADRQSTMLAFKELKLRSLVAEGTEIHIINKEALLWLWNHFGQGRRWPYNVIVSDDLREARSGKKRSKGRKDQPKAATAPLSRFGVLARARKFVDATIILTGTPTPKGLQNMWGLAYLVDLGARLGTARTAFEQRWFNIDRDRYLSIAIDI